MSVLFVTLQGTRYEYEKIRFWYPEHLGMKVIRVAPYMVTVGYPSKPNSCCIEFRVHHKPTARYVASDTDLYWKVSLCMPDVNLARERLIKLGLHVSAPVQFRDIGYLCHTKDFIGYNMELLQHRFESNFTKKYAEAFKDETSPIRQIATVGLLTIRVTNADRSKKFYSEVMGMKLLSSQHVCDAFDLHFFADTTEEPPNKDPWSVDNREWLYSRDFTSLELQVKHGVDHFDATPSDMLGYRGFGLGVKADIFHSLKKTYSSTVDSDYGEEVIHVTDPDGHAITVFCRGGAGK
ncbi:hypothetical protein FOL47_008473 [Perkinsus chesapeaki]|uniref:VOC domain-containing protein n=1 Tax=Perkinsus chesapeaki TaxID=330153 RepID=A0A7J6LDP8_PERCH|nr:hypothetical protein FOL47_008473 [Perkinsus chesapeaki]